MFTRLIILMTFVTLIGCNKVEFENTGSNAARANLPDDGNNPNPGNPTPVELTNVTSEFVASGTNNKVDILFVIDNSGSMGQEQARMQESLGHFTGTLNNIDWRIAITSTDPRDYNSPGYYGRLYNMVGSQKYLTPATPDYDLIFRDKVYLGESGSGNERGIEVTSRALARNESGWMRLDADLAVVVLTDEDEDSTGETTAAISQPQNLVNQFNSLYANKNFTFHTLAILDEECRAIQGSQPRPTGSGTMPAYIGQKYIAASQLTGGVTGSICAPDYVNELISIGDRIIEVNRAFTLECSPYNGQIEITLSSGGAPNYNLQGNKLIFTSDLLPGTQITADYQCEQ